MPFCISVHTHHYFTIIFEQLLSNYIFSNFSFSSIFQKMFHHSMFVHLHVRGVQRVELTRDFRSDARIEH